MPLKRKERVAAPPGPDEWDVRAATNEAGREWENVCSQAATNARWAWGLMRQDPLPARPTNRHHRLKGALGTSSDGLPVWQIELTGGGRIWYQVDTAKRTVWLTKASLGHPKETE